MAGKATPNNRTIPRRPRRSAFTLIELLVVVSIISVLVTILLPSLSKAKQLARGTVCLTNVRRLALAGHMYLTENREIFPPVRMKYGRDGGTYINDYGRTKPRWHWFLEQDGGPVINPSDYAGGTFGDSDTRTMTNNNFMCPSFRGEYERDIRNGAYGYNYQYLGDSRAVSNGRYTNFPVTEAEIDLAGQAVFFGDSRGGDPNHGQHSYTLDPPKLAASRGVTKFGPSTGKDGPIGHSPAEARHGDAANVSFVDGHAAVMTLEDLGYELDEEDVVTPGVGSNLLWGGMGDDEK